MGEVHPFAPARTAQHEERHESQPHADPLIEVEPLAEDEHGAHQHHHGACGVDGSDNRYGQVFDAEVAENPRGQHDRRLEHHQPVRMRRTGRRSEHRAVEPAPAALGRENGGQKDQRREKRIEQQHRQHGIVGESRLFGRVVESEQRRRNECKGQPHNSSLNVYRAAKINICRSCAHTAGG